MSVININLRIFFRTTFETTRVIAAWTLTYCIYAAQGWSSRLRALLSPENLKVHAENKLGGRLPPPQESARARQRSISPNVALSCHSFGELCLSKYRCQSPYPYRETSRRAASVAEFCRWCAADAGGRKFSFRNLVYSFFVQKSRTYTARRPPCVFDTRMMLYCWIRGNDLIFLSLSLSRRLSGFAVMRPLMCGINLK